MLLCTSTPVFADISLYEYAHIQSTTLYEYTNAREARLCTSTHTHKRGIPLCTSAHTVSSLSAVALQCLHGALDRLADVIEHGNLVAIRQITEVRARAVVVLHRVVG